MASDGISGGLRLGCPVFAFEGWRGSLYTRAAPRRQFLPQYASVFGAVEGNSTFYGLPSEATVRRWAAASPPGFRFCCKFPRQLTHEGRLGADSADGERFLALMRLLPERTGPLLLQLGPGFGPSELPLLERYLARLPRDFRYAVEVRHPGWYDGGAAERELDAVLGDHGVARCNFDTSDLFGAAEVDATTAIAQRRKPRLPRRAVVTAHAAFVRFVGQNRVERSRGALRFWAERVARWLGDGREVYFFTHTPDDAMAPRLARLFHALLRERVPALPPLPAFPGEAEAAPPPRPEQARLL